MTKRVLMPATDFLVCHCFHPLSNMYQLPSPVWNRPFVFFASHADNHLMLVEPACGASLAAVYSGVVRKLQSEGKLGPVQNVVVIVCGGRATNPEQHNLWKKQLGLLD